MRKLLTGIAFLFMALFIYAAPSALGQACNSTSQCSFGYCEGGKCFLPQLDSYDVIGNCNTTQDCSLGYCSPSGLCIVPKAPTATTFSFLPSIKSGCSGLMEETKDFGSFAVCSLFWILVPIVSISAGLAGRNEKIRIIPFIAFFIPLLVALFSVPYIGLIIATLELVLLSARNFV